MKKLMWCAVSLLGFSVAADAVTFSTFVGSGAINAVEGQNNTIAFTYAGNKFIGSVYTGANNLQLYSTDLNGGNVQKFGTAMSNGFSGEVVVGGALGRGGFTSGDVFAGAGTQLFHYTNSGGAPVAFGSAFDATIRGILFDPGSSFGGNMLVSTSNGKIWSVTSGGIQTLLANVGEDTEGMDIATSNWGTFAGQLLVGCP
jgi:hypothetical protein